MSKLSRIKNLLGKLKDNADNMGKAGYIDNAYLDKINNELENTMRKELGYDQLQLDWYKKQLQEGSANRWEKNQPSITIGDEELAKVIKDGRFKSQYEANQSSGYYNPNERNITENKMFGTHTDRMSESNPGKMPIYGSQDGKLRNLQAYGQHLVLLNPEMKDRMTYTIGDSLNDGAVAGRYGFPDWSAAFSKREDFIDSMKDYNTQIADLEDDIRVKMEDIANDARLSPEQKGAMKSRILLDQEELKELEERKKRYFDSKVGGLFDRIRDLNGKEVEYPVGYIENQYHGGVSTDDVDGVLLDFAQDYLDNPEMRKQIPSYSQVSASDIESAVPEGDARKQWGLINDKRKLFNDTFPSIWTKEQVDREIERLRRTRPELGIETLDDLNKYYTDDGSRYIVVKE